MWNPINTNAIERRREPRLETDCDAGVKVTASAPLVSARLVSVSSRGLQLRVGFIFPNEAVQVRLADRTVAGRVRYCVSSGDEFRIGVQIERAG